MYRLALLALAVVPNLALANRAPPPPRPPEKVQPTLVIEVDDSVKQARLIVPRAMLQGQPEPPKRGAWLPVPTVVVALCLSAGLLTGGLWVARRGRGGLNRTTLTAILALTLLAAGAAAVYADLPGRTRPPRPPEPPPVAVPSGIPVVVEVSDGDQVKLVISSQMQKQMADAKPGRSGK